MAGSESNHQSYSIAQRLSPPNVANDVELFKRAGLVDTSSNFSS